MNKKFVSVIMSVLLAFGHTPQIYAESTNEAETVETTSESQDIKEEEAYASGAGDADAQAAEVHDGSAEYSGPADGESVPESSDNEISGETMVEPEETEESGQEETDSDISASAEKEEERQIGTVPAGGKTEDSIMLKFENEITKCL